MNAARRILGSPVYRRRWIYLIGGIALAAGIVWISGHVWWISSGYCFGDLISCHFPEAKP